MAKKKAERRVTVNFFVVARKEVYCEQTKIVIVNIGGKFDECEHGVA